MRTIGTALAQVYGAGSYKAMVRVKIEDADGTLQDITSFHGRNWLNSASWGESVDDNGMTASIVLERDVYDDSLAPLVEATRTNLDSGGSYDPILDLRREVVIETAVVALDITPASGDWVERFRGQIDRIEWADAEIKLSCRDQVALLIDRYIETVDTYGGTSGSPQDVEDAMQDILDDTLAGSAPTIYTPTTPGWAISEFTSTNQSLLDQLRLLVDQIGWDLRYKWDSGTSAFRLTFYEIDRANTTPDYTFGPSDYSEITQMDLDLAGIRNAVSVTYQTGNDESGEPETATYTSTDATSISRYGRRWMGIAEDASSHIDTATEAQAMADACVADLKDPVAHQTARLTNYFGEVELGDLYTFEANGTHYDTDKDLGVVAYQHVFDQDDCYTEIVAEGATPIGSKIRWHRMGATPGINRVQDTSGPDLEPITAATAVGGVNLDLPGIRSVLNGGRGGLRYEIHVGTSSGFTPDSTSYWGKTSEPTVFLPYDDALLPAGETRYIKVIGVDERNNKGTATAAASVVVGLIGAAVLDSSVSLGTFSGGAFSGDTRGASFLADGWDVLVGTLGADILMDS